MFVVAVVAGGVGGAFVAADGVVCLLVCFFACLLVCLVVCLFGWLVVCLFVWLFVCLFVCCCSAFLAWSSPNFDETSEDPLIASQFVRTSLLKPSLDGRIEDFIPPLLD